MLRIAICEGNDIFINQIKSCIEAMLTESEIEYNIQCFSSGENLIRYINNQLDIFYAIFFDIQLDNMTGIETAQAIRNFDSLVKFIFITSCDEKVYEVFKLNTYDFIRKKYLHFELKKVMERICDEINSTITVSIKKEDYYIQKYIKINDIKYINIIDRHLIIHTGKNEEFTTTYRTFTSFPKLDSKKFIEITRGIIVNLDYIQDYNKKNLYVTMLPGFKIKVSRRKMRYFEKLFFSHFKNKKRS